MNQHNPIPVETGCAADNGQMSSAVLEGVPTPLIVVRVADRVAMINAAARHLLRLNTKEIGAPELKNLFPNLNSVDCESLKHHFGKRQTPTETGETDLKIRRGDGSYFGAGVTFNLIGGERPTACILSIRDKTSDQEGAEEQIKARNNLEFRVRIRTVELAEKVRDLDVAKKQLSQTVLDMRRETAAREESEARMRSILDTAAEGIIIIDDTGIITTFNRAAETIFQWQASEAIGKNISILVPGPVAVAHDGFLARYRQTGVSKVIGATNDLIGKRKNGETFPLEISVSETRVGDHTSFTGIARDISERRENERKMQATLDKLRETQSSLIESEKMASLGSLVAGVAHEINTPVGIGVTAATYLNEQIANLRALFTAGKITKANLDQFLETASQSVEILESNLNRASDLIRSFKQVAVDQSNESYREIGLQDYINETLLSLKPQLSRTAVKTVVDIDPTISMVTNPGALSQIVTNLVMNSLIHAYAPDSEGTLSIAARLDNDSVVMTYKDDGKGMGPEEVRKIFEPFFTTKRGSGGSGLGMHIVFNLVHQSLGGEITCSSEPGQGVTFQILLPATPEKTEEVA